MSARSNRGAAMVRPALGDGPTGARMTWYLGSVVLGAAFGDVQLGLGRGGLAAPDSSNRGAISLTLGSC